MSWLEPLLDPSPLIRASQRETTRDPRIGLALLLEAQFRRYRGLAEENDWPPLGEPAEPHADAGRRLLAALGLHFVGDRRAEREYQRLARSRDSAFRTLVAVLTSIYFRDLGRQADAVSVLERRMKRSSDGLEQMLLGLHLGNRFAEEGAWEAALAATEVARGHRASAKPVRWRDQLGWVAEQNIFQFNWRLGRLASEFPRAAPRSALP